MSGTILVTGGTIGDFVVEGLQKKGRKVRVTAPGMLLESSRSSLTTQGPMDSSAPSTAWNPISSFLLSYKIYTHSLGRANNDKAVNRGDRW